MHLPEAFMQAYSICKRCWQILENVRRMKQMFFRLAKTKAFAFLKMTHLLQNSSNFQRLFFTQLFESVPVCRAKKLEVSGPTIFPTKKWVSTSDRFCCICIYCMVFFRYSAHAERGKVLCG